MDDIALLLKNYLKKEKATREFERGLIFLDILDFISFSIPKRKKSNANNENELQQINNLYNSLDKDIKFYLSLSYLPLCAYYYYSISNFKLAIEDLENFIKNSHIILNGNPKLETLAKCEQILNLFNVYFTSKDFKNANIYATDLIIYSVYNRESEFIKGYDVRNIENSFYWTPHIVESIFIKYLHENNLIDTGTFCEENRAFHLGFNFLKAYYNEDYSEAREYAIILLKLEEVLMKKNEYNFEDCQKIIQNFIVEKVKNKKYLEDIFLLKDNQLILK